MLRCKNFDNNPTKMIDLILNRLCYRIILDRLLIQDLIQENILIIDATFIKKYSITYFQNYILPKDPLQPINKC